MGGRGRGQSTLSKAKEEGDEEEGLYRDKIDRELTEEPQGEENEEHHPPPGDG